ncbi:MAG TPA: DNA-directed RNA polymerase subunit beta' [Planctomycetia bacterium]|nr:DNA-directed RNA polymerase subunit beta' [Planctomycetia bacterium]
MSAGETAYDRVNDYAAVKISLASPHNIRDWSFGEVKKPETINYRTYRPEKDGLFCERIFGPEKDWECSCGKYRGMKYKGMVCDRCGVKVTHSRVRRKRMGHIELAAPVVHIWFFKAMPSRLGTLLDMRTTALEKVIYYQDWVVVEVNSANCPLKVGELLSDEAYRQSKDKYGDTFDADMGAEAIRRLLKQVDLIKLPETLRKALSETRSKQKQKDIGKRLKVLEALRDSENKPEWMVLDVIPVIPPDLRPLVLLDSGNFATSDLNDLYRRIINRNNRLKKLVDLNAPEVIIRNEKRMLQQSVDALFDNSRCKRPVLGSSNRPLKSLTDMIKGKQGRFRENLLGKRVDYSARSVIVVGPDLKLHQCGLPAKKIALELFQPFIIRRLKELGHADTIKSAKKMLERRDDPVWDILDEVVKNHPVLLNRAPTLHRMGIQAFEPVLIEGNAIKIHPLVCKGFNADFDGDQMAVHLPLSIEAQVEASTLMMSTNNIFSPANGSPIISPSQDIVMGCYYMTVPRRNDPGEGRVFASKMEVFLAYQLGKVGIHAKVKVRLPANKTVAGEGAETFKRGGLLDTTVGRVLFNDILHDKMPFYNQTNGQKQLAGIIADCYRNLGRRETIALLDRMKETGFHNSTVSGLSFATDDLKTPDSKTKYIAAAEKEIQGLQRAFQRALITEQERYTKVLDAWTKASEEITKALMEDLKNDERDGEQYLNPIYLMATSGARGGVAQIRQLAGMRGLMAKPNGQIIEEPIKANFRQGLTVLEYFSSTHGARKGLADTALKTADSGYLTRKLCDVAQNVVITLENCGTTRGITKGVLFRGELVDRSLADSIRGRVARRNIVDLITDEVIVRENQMITHEIAQRIERLKIDKIEVRSPMTCEASLGICQLCYGMDLATGDMVEPGQAVGVIAAQSIGEPGTQLTMRTFHSGGQAERHLQGSEARNKKAGAVRYDKINVVDAGEGNFVALSRNGEIAIVDKKGRELEKFPVPNGASLLVKEGQEVAADTLLCKWDPHTLPILATVGGSVHLEDVVEGETLRIEKDATGVERWQVTEHKGDRHPQIIIKDAIGTILDIYYIPEKAYVEVRDGQQIKPGAILCKTPRDDGGTQDITGGLPRVTEVFEARRPKEPAVIAEVDGVVEVLPDKKRGKRTIIIRTDTGDAREHLIPTGKQLKIRSKDHVRAGDSLCEGPLVPHEILRINGEESVQDYLVKEVQNVYRLQRVEIDDKHIEIIIAAMLRKVKIDDAGDTGLLPGAQLDRFILRRKNDELADSIKVVNIGDSDYRDGAIVPKAEFQETVNRLTAEGSKPPSGKAPMRARASVQLLGITKAAVQSESFISAASFQETTKVLTQAALASKLDTLVGLKENVILGHLIPAGTGFKMNKEAEVRIRPEALEELEEEIAEEEAMVAEEAAAAAAAVKDEEA